MECIGLINSITPREIKDYYRHHEELKKEGACFGVSGEYERPMWYALNNEKAEYKYSFDYQNWYHIS